MMPPGGNANWSETQSPKPTNGFAITALVTSLVLAPLGIVFGHLALRQIARTGENGRGLAIGGLVLGYLFTAIGAVWLIYTVVALSAFTSALSADTESDSHYPSTTTSLRPPPPGGVHISMVPADGPDLRSFGRGDCLEVAGPTGIQGWDSCKISYSVYGAPVYEITSKTTGDGGSCPDDYVRTVYDLYCLRPYTP
nr:DUF4190 domain-containing protein [Mycobacterium sp.]